jgi:uncharacterized repeat protein (TIGR01451 family)
MKLKTLAFIAASSVMALPAFAADLWEITANDTAFLTQVSNTATLNYAVNGIDQTAITDKNTFYVDRKVVFSMTRTGDAVQSINANGTREFTETYTVQNDSNAPIGIKLPATLTSSTMTATGGTTASDPDNNGFYTLAKGDANTGTTTDTLTITVTTTLTDDDITSGEVKYDLTITAVEPEDVAAVAGSDTTAGTPAVTAGDAIVITPATTEWNGLLLQTVGITIVGDDDNSGSLRSEPKTYTINKPIVSLVKTALVTKDPITGELVVGGNQPKAIPGATIRYSLVVTNTGKAEAVGIVLTDDLSPLDDRLTFTDTESSSKIINADDTVIANSGATLSSNVLTFPAVNVPAATFLANGDVDVAGKITATFEVVLK